jgi:tetratricopeptide (TPR) repeat protein
LTLATVLAKQGQTADAAAERKRAADLMRANMNRQRAEVASNSAKSLLRSGKVDDSIAQYKEALSYDPGYSEAHRGLAAALERQGNAAEASAERQKADSLEKAQKE